MHIYEMAAIFYFFIMTGAKIPFPKCKFSIGSVSLSPHHFILCSVPTSNHDDDSTLETFSMSTYM